jgi:manganese/zinc/iron transport system permease protein
MKGGYFGKTFGQFFELLWNHLLRVCRGEYGFSDLAADEVQLITLILLSVSAAIVGSLLVIRKMTMVANAISHTVLLGVVGSFLILHFFLGRPFSELLEIDMKLLILAALIASLLTMVCIDFFHHTLKLGRDSSIGLVFTSLFSLGILLVTIFTKNMHIGSEIIMGNVDMIHRDDIWIALSLVIGNFLIFSLLYKEYLITSFDPGFAKLVKISPLLFNYIVIFQISVTLVAAFRAVGVVLILALLIVPPVTARLFVKSLNLMIYASIFIGVIASISAVALSRHILTVYETPLSTSGLVVTILLLIWVGSLFFSKKRLRNFDKQIES